MLAAVARLHALHIDDVHLPFGGEALTRFGHPLPLSTREAYRDADAILVSSPDDPAVDGVMADLDLAWRVSRVHNQPRGDLDRGRAGRSCELTSSRSRARSRSRRRGVHGSPRSARTRGMERAGRRAGGRLGRSGRRAADAARRAHALPRPPGHGRPRGRARTSSPARSWIRPRISRAACTRSRAAASRRRARASSRPRCATTTRSPASASRMPQGHCWPPRCCSPKASATARRRGRSNGPSPRACTRHQDTQDTRSFTDAVIGRFPTRVPTPSSSRRSAMTRMYGSDAILRSLEAEGVDVMFGIPGGAILPTYDAIARGTTVRHVLARHEQGAGHMAEGYARASGKVGVAMATSGPGATNLVTPIADAWMDSTPLVCITGQVRSNLIGTDAFQETDATGITMPIVKHSWLVQDVRELPQVMKNAFHVARTGRPGPRARRHREGRAGGRDRLLVSRRGRHARLEAADEGARAPGARGGEGDRRGAAADHLRGRRRHQRRGLARSCSRSSRRRGCPAVVTLMGKGCLPDSHPLNYGMPGMHGSKYGELGAQQVRPDHRRRHALRRPRHRQGLGVRARREGDPLRHRRGRGRTRSATRRSRSSARSSSRSSQLTREVKALEADRPTERTAWHAQLEEWRASIPYKYRRAEGVLKPQTVVETLRDMTAGARRRDLDDRRRPAPDVGDAVPRLRPAAHVHHLGRARDDGLRRAGGGRREGGAARRDRRLHRRRRLLPDDVPGARDRGARAAADRGRDRQQRLARDGAPVAGALLRGALRRDAPDEAGARLRRSSPTRSAAPASWSTARTTSSRRSRRRSTAAAPPSSTRASIPNENCYPMVPAGAASVDVIELPDEMPDGRPRRSPDEPPHRLGPAREQARRARARLAALRAARLQHPVARGRADRAARHLAAHDARRLLRALVRADREADPQARQRPARDRAPARRVGRARAGADHRRRAARQARRGDRARRGLRRARRRHRPRRAHVRDRRTARRSSTRSRSSSARTACASSRARAGSASAGRGRVHRGSKPPPSPSERNATRWRK